MVNNQAAEQFRGRIKYNMLVNPTRIPLKDARSPWLGEQGFTRVAEAEAQKQSILLFGGGSYWCRSQTFSGKQKLNRVTRTKVNGSLSWQASDIILCPQEATFCYVSPLFYFPCKSLLDTLHVIWDETEPVGTEAFVVESIPVPMRVNYTYLIIWVSGTGIKRTGEVPSPARSLPSAVYDPLASPGWQHLEFSFTDKLRRD